MPQPNNKRPKMGLKELPRDSRDFTLGKIVELPALETLPKEFTLKPLSIKYQGGSDFCTSFSCCGASEMQEGVVLSPEWGFAVSKMISGHKDSYGQDLRSAMKAHTKYGAIKASETNHDLEHFTSKKLRDIKNYDPYLFDRAVEHKKKSYVSVDGRYDDFDNIRASIWKFRKEKRAVMSGALWNWTMKKAIIPNMVTNRGVGHAFYFIGWKIINGTQMLVLVNSYGNWSGDNGLFYMPRKVVNAFARRFGSYMWLDLSPEELKKEQWNLIQKLLDRLNKLLLKLKQIIKNERS